MLAAGGGGGRHVGRHDVHAFRGRDGTQRAHGADGHEGIHGRHGGAGLRLDDGTLRQGAAAVVLRPEAGLALHGLGAENDAEVGAL